MIDERGLGGDEGFEVIFAVAGIAGARAGPFGIGRRLRGRRRLALVGSFVGKDVAKVGAEALLYRGAAGLEIVTGPILRRRAVR
jgi:hypothetical protein